MKRLLIAIQLLVSALLAADLTPALPFELTEIDPSAIVGGCIHAITGDLILKEPLATVRGAVPISLPANYVSRDHREKIGKGWQREHYFYAYQLQSGELIVREPSGADVVYTQRGKIAGGWTIFKPVAPHTWQGFTIIPRPLPGVAHQRFLDHHIDYASDGKDFYLHRSDGSRLLFTQTSWRLCPPSATREGIQRYLLRWEEHPHGERFTYEYDKNDALIAISSTTPDGNHRFAHLGISYKEEWEKHKKKKKTHETTLFFFQGTDGQLTSMRTTPHFKLLSVWGENVLSRQFNYYLGKQDGACRAIERYDLQGGRTLQVKYHQGFPGDSTWRVSALAAPVGEHGEEVEIFRLEYLREDANHPVRKGRTNVCDPYGFLTSYTYTHGHRLEHLVRWIPGGGRRSEDHFAWDPQGRLHGHYLITEEKRTLFGKHLLYDERSCLREAAMLGNLTGEQLDDFSFRIEHGGALSGETPERYSCSYQYTGSLPHLLVKQSEEKGVETTYSYLPGKSLVASKLVAVEGRIIRRTFYEYDRDLLLVTEIEDDGSSPHQEDLTDVSERHLTRIHRLYDVLFHGMPEVHERFYLDLGSGQAGLLSREYLRYNSAGLVERKEICDANGQHRYTLHYQYNKMGQLVWERNAIGQEASYHRDDGGRVISETLFSGRGRKIYSYDRADRQTHSSLETNEGNRRSLTRYDLMSRPRVITDPFQNPTEIEYDPYGNAICKRSPWVETASSSQERPTVRRSYDSGGRVHLAWDEEGHLTETLYNARGQPTLVRHPDGTEERHFYTKSGLLAKLVAPDGTVTQQEYDPLDRIISKKVLLDGEVLTEESFLYNSFHLLAQTDAEGFVTEYQYDGAGRKIAEERAGRRTDYSYDELGRLARTTLRGDGDSLITSNRYDLLDRLIEERVEAEDGTPLSLIEYEYDSAGNRTLTSTYVEGRPSVSQTLYDAFNRVIRETSPRGEVTETYYAEQKDQFGQTICTKRVVDATGAYLEEIYDVRGLVTEKRRGQSGRGILSREHLFYDRRGLLCRVESSIFESETEVRSAVLEKEYDSGGRLTLLREGVGTPEERVTRYTYNSRGLIEQIEKPDGVTLEHRYNPLGHLISLRASDGTVALSYSVDRLGRVIETHDELTDQTVHRCYNAFGEILEEWVDGSKRLTSHYNSLGQRTLLTLPDGSSVHYRYLGNRMESLHRYSAEGEKLYQQLFLDYDSSGHLTRMQLPGKSGIVEYQYDAAGITESVTCGSFRHQVTALDPRGLVTATLWQLGDLAEESHFSYDPLRQLTEESGRFAKQIRHDSLHNRVQDGEQHLLYNALHEMEGVPHTPCGEPLEQPSSSGPYRCFYDALGRLTRAEREGEFCLLFSYDGFHRRTSRTLFLWRQGKWKFQQEQQFLFDGLNEIGTLDGSHLQQLRILAAAPLAEIGATVAIEEGGSLFAVLHDLFGNIALLLDPATGAPLQAYRYSAFGERAPLLDSSISSPWGHSSKRHDPHTGLIFFGRRYYQPLFGRWLTPDPKGHTDSLNLYAFLKASPLRSFDLYGLETTTPEEERSPSLWDRFAGWFSETFSQPTTSSNENSSSIDRTFRSDRHHDGPEVFEVPGREIPGVHLTFTPGINTFKQKAWDMAKSVSLKSGGARVEVFYPGSYGFWDAKEAAKDYVGIPTGAANFVAKCFKNKLNSIPRGDVLVHSVHSRGNLIYQGAVKQLSYDERQRIHFRGYGSPKTEELSDHASMNYHICESDAVAWLDAIRFFTKEGREVVEEMQAQKRYVKRHPLIKSDHPDGAHGFLAPTYQKALEDDMKELFGRLGIE